MDYSYLNRLDVPGNISFRQFHYLKQLYRDAGRQIEEQDLAYLSRDEASRKITELLEEIKWKQSTAEVLEQHIKEMLDQKKKSKEKVDEVISFCLMLRNK